jgi:hypothetical protein
MVQEEIMSTLTTLSPLHLLSLPTEIQDYILDLAFIPDRLWINALHRRDAEWQHPPLCPSTVFLPPPFAMLCYTIPNVGSQFCVQRLSLNRLMISKSLYASLKSLLCHRTILQFGDAPSFLSLMRRAGNYIASFGFRRVSLEINENIGPHMGLTVDLLQDFESSFAATLDLVEVRLALRQLSQPPSRDEVLARSKYVSWLGLFIVRLALLSEPHDDVPSAPAHREVRIPLLLQEPMRQELLNLKDIDRHCEVFWTETGRDRYAGPTGSVRLRPKRDKASLCCHSDFSTLAQVLADEQYMSVPVKKMACATCLFHVSRWRRAKQREELAAERTILNIPSLGRLAKEKNSCYP